jgi:hypothetical protein
MHHPDISNILKTLDDYFLISAPDSLATVKGKKLEWGNDDSLVISRELKNGRLEIHIKGQDEDDDNLDVVYYQQGSTEAYDKTLHIKSDDYNIEVVRKAIRDLVIYDANPDEIKPTEKSVDNWLNKHSDR